VKFYFLLIAAVVVIIIGVAVYQMRKK